jgi:hypothetical protein
MKYRLRTALGDSNKYYHHSSPSPIHGTGQGSCASPAFWLLTSSTLMNCLAELAGGMTMADAVDRKKNLLQWIDGFVDDTSLFYSLNTFSKHCNDICLLTTALKQDLVSWKELLEATGGKLELKKCFYYIMSWRFDGKGNAIPTKIEEQRAVCDQIMIEDAESGNIWIEQKNVTESHRTLGVNKNMVGDEEDNKKILKQKCDQFVSHLKNNMLTRKQVMMVFNMMFIPSMKYGLPATSLSVKDIESIQSYAIDKFLPAMGFEHSTPRDLIFGPEEFGGFNIQHLFTEMMGTKLDTLISHIRASSNLG